VFLSSYSFLNPEERQRLESDKTMRLLQEQIVAHETAHQWWGDLITWTGYRDQWLMEALANYSSLMLLESHDPAGFHDILRKYRDDLLNKSANGKSMMDAGPVTFGLRLSSSQFPDGYEVISYGRGTWLLHMLRTMMRDSQHTTGSSDAEPFFKILRKLRNDYEGKSLTTADFIAAFEAGLPHSLWYEGHKSLDWFLQGWINGSAVPHLELHDTKITDGPKSALASGKIAVSEAPDSLVTPVPIYAVVGNRNVFLGRVFAEGPETTFRLSAPLHARKIVIDPDGSVLARR
jgi:aminopeptidase N